jgi:GNAT superfamily N-acetyltransferase
VGVLDAGAQELVDALRGSDGHFSAGFFVVRALRRAKRQLALHHRPVWLSATSAALLKRVMEGVRGYNRIICASSPRGRVLELDGVTAGVMPDVPERAVMNAVVYERPEALAGALDGLAASYAEAGVHAWAVWVPAVDRQAKRLLRRAGHRLEANPTAMAHELRGSERPARRALERWTGEGDPALLAAICDRAFLFGTAFTRALSGLPPDGARVYLASLDGEPVSCLLTSDYNGNCAVDAVATVPEVQRRGLASALLGHALADAAERGCTTATLVATPMSRAIYERLGFRPLCTLQQWQRIGAGEVRSSARLDRRRG